MYVADRGVVRQEVDIDPTYEVVAQLDVAARPASRLTDAGFPHDTHRSMVSTARTGEASNGRRRSAITQGDAGFDVNRCGRLRDGEWWTIGTACCGTAH